MDQTNEELVLFAVTLDVKVAATCAFTKIRLKPFVALLSPQRYFAIAVSGPYSSLLPMNLVRDCDGLQFKTMV